MIGACDCCDRQNVPVAKFRADQTSAQCETTACFLCQGDSDPDPYGELEGSLAWNEANGQFGVGA